MLTSNTELAAQALLDGKLVIFPTETVYGIGANAESPKAVLRIYDIKRRPKNHPFIIHLAESDLVNFWVEKIPAYVQKLIDSFWPGPLTLILKRNEKLSLNILRDQESLALRVPSNKIATDLLKAFTCRGGHGVVAPSANLFGMTSPTTTEEALVSIGDKLDMQDVVLEGDKSELGLESTIVDCTEAFPKILRPGFITKSDLEKLLDLKIVSNNFNANSKLHFPGTSKSHYSPKAEVRLDKDYIEGSGFIALSKFKTPIGLIRLMSPTNVVEFSKELYSSFFKADFLKLKYIFVELPPEQGVGVALSDRLTRASKHAQI
jgi:L-threonylcarbamoyladenylate synthase